MHRPHRSSKWGMYARMYGHIWEHQWGMHARIYGHIWGQQWGIHTRIYGPLLLLYMAYSCPYELYIVNAKRLVQIRYKALRFLIVFLIILIFVPLNGVCIRAYIVIYRGIYRPYKSSIRVYIGVYIDYMGVVLGYI